MLLGFKVIIMSFSSKFNNNYIYNMFFEMSSRVISTFNILKSLMQIQALAKVIILIKENKFK